MGTRYDFEGLKQLWLKVLEGAVQDVQRGPEYEAITAADWLTDTGWRLMVAFEIPTNRSRVAKWAVGMLNSRAAGDRLARLLETGVENHAN